MSFPASESQHWYTRTGEPAYTVKSKDGTERPATLRDAKKLGLVPSVTTIIGCCAKPGLERWKLDQMMHAALTLPRKEGEFESSWIKRVWADSRETARKAAERGTKIHNAIEDAYKDRPTPHEFKAHVDGAVNEVGRTYGPAPIIAEGSFASPLGFGGKVDLHRPYGDRAVIDFKTKEFGEADDLKTWDEHSMQLAAYRHGLNIPQARCAIVYVSVTNPGLTRLIEIKEPDLQLGWKMFYSLLHYWQAKNGYQSSFERLAA
jgi:hypothetical protein